MTDQELLEVQYAISRLERWVYLKEEATKRPPRFDGHEEREKVVRICDRYIADWEAQIKELIRKETAA